MDPYGLSSTELCLSAPSATDSFGNKASDPSEKVSQPSDLQTSSTPQESANTAGALAWAAYEGYSNPGSLVGIVLPDAQGEKKSTGQKLAQVAGAGTRV